MVFGVMKAKQTAAAAVVVVDTVVMIDPNLKGHGNHIIKRTMVSR